MKLDRIKVNTTWSDASASINSNNDKIAESLARLNDATYKNKGYFTTAEALRDAYPTATAGTKAYVGTSFPYSIYVWSTTVNAWVDTTLKGGDETVPLGDYYTKEQTQEVIDDYHVILSQEEYDALEVKEDKLYFIYEE